MPRPPASRVALAPLLSLALSACGEGGGEPRQGGRTADQLAAGLSAGGDAARESADRLAEMARTHPEPVLRALEAALLAAPAGPAPAAVTLSFAADRDAAARLGLPPAEDGETLALALGPVRNRAAALGEAVRLRAARGVLEVEVEARAREELEGLQRVLGVRGAFELALVVHDVPTRPGALYRGTVPLERLRADDAARHAAARAAGRPFEPADPLHPSLPRHGAQGLGPEALVTVRAPRTPEEAWTEDAFSEAAARATAAGETLELTVVPSRRTAMRRLTEANVGGQLALVLDGEVLAAATLHEPLDDRLSVSLPPGLGARALAAVVRGGRLPRPLRALPLPEGTRSAETPLARAFVAVGPAAVPVLERVAAGTASAAAKAQAAWALARLRPPPVPAPAR